LIRRASSAGIQIIDIVVSHTARAGSIILARVAVVKAGRQSNWKQN